MFRRPARIFADRSTLLAAAPLRNPAVREAPLSKTQTRLTAPLQQNMLTRLFGTRAPTKSFDLDELGLYVWRACDGSTSVETIITQFAQAHRVNVREAEVAVGTFLRTLLQRNLIALPLPLPVTQSSQP